MTPAHESLARAWGDVARDMALTGLKAELDGLAAMFSVLSASGLLPPMISAPAPSAEDFAMDNLPV